MKIGIKEEFWKFFLCRGSIKSPFNFRKFTCVDFYLGSNVYLFQLLLKNLSFLQSLSCFISSFFLSQISKSLLFQTHKLFFDPYQNHSFALLKSSICERCRTWVLWYLGSDWNSHTCHHWPIIMAMESQLKMEVTYWLYLMQDIP